jgi:integrase
MGADRDKKNRINKVLKYLETYPGGSAIQIAQVNEKWFIGFQSYLLKSPELSPGTANSYAGAVRIALNRAAHENIISRNPATGVKTIQAPEVDKVFLNALEIQCLADTDLGGTLGAEVKRAFLFACFTGLRISDLKSLAWGDIEHNPEQIIKRQKKTGRKVYAPLNETAWKIINDKTIHRHTELVFPVLGKTQTNTNQYLTAWAGRARLEKRIGWHTARHTFAVLALESGADISTVSKLLGHTKLATTMIYAKVTDKLKREAVNALPIINVEGAAD